MEWMYPSVFFSAEPLQRRAAIRQPADTVPCPTLDGGFVSLTHRCFEQISRRCYVTEYHKALCTGPEFRIPGD
jgi:hypothetical protein